MQRLGIRIFILFLGSGLISSLLQAQGLATHWESRSPMPEPRSNLATATWSTGDTTWIYAFMGLDSSKACGNGIRLESFRYNTVSDVWDTLPPVPDTRGRIAASASMVNNKIYLIGGYQVFPNCNEVTSPRVDIFDPQTKTWSAGTPIPFPTDDHVQAVWRDSLIICISGWSQNTNIKRVQVYDPGNDSWAQSTQISGPGLFGHCGSISGDTLMYIDGVRINLGSFQLINQVWKGVMQNGNPLQIAWTNLGTHSGDKVYRGASFGYGERIVFSQGTDNAYNIDGIGYNGNPSIPQGRTFGYNLATQAWEEYSSNPDSVMDVREEVQVGNDQFYFVGGMDENQRVTGRVSVLVIDSVLVGRKPPIQPIFNTFWQDKQLQVQWEMKTPGPAKVSVTDINGQLVFAQDWDHLASGSQQKMLSLSGLTAGIYFVRLVTPEGQAAQKILKQN